MDGETDPLFQTINILLVCLNNCYGRLYFRSITGYAIYIICPQMQIILCNFARHEFWLWDADKKNPIYFLSIVPAIASEAILLLIFIGNVLMFSLSSIYANVIQLLGVIDIIECRIKVCLCVPAFSSVKRANTETSSGNGINLNNDWGVWLS